MIGGISLFGGAVARSPCPLIGALIVGVFQSGLRIAGVDVLWQVFAHRLVDHLCRRNRSVDQEGIGHDYTDTERTGVMISRRTTLHPTVGRATDNQWNQCSAAGTWSSAMAASPHSTMPISSCTQARSLQSSATMAPASRPLIKAVSGAAPPDAGEVRLDGKPVHFRSPMEARLAGIETLCTRISHCHRRCRSRTTCSSDVKYAAKASVVGGSASPTARRCRRLPREKLSDLGLMTIQDINQPVENALGWVSARVWPWRAAAAFGSKVIIMDEPTAALGVKESRKVLELIQDVRSKGIADRADLTQHAARVRGG